MQRKKLLIYPRFQLSLLAANAAMNGLMFFVGWLLTSRSFTHLRELGLKAEIPPTHAYFPFLAFEARQIAWGLLAAFAITLALSSTLILVLSHRLAGPIVRLRSYFHSMGWDPLRDSQRPLVFRKGDFFSDLPGVINSALDRVDHLRHLKSKQLETEPLKKKDQKVG